MKRWVTQLGSAASRQQSVGWWCLRVGQSVGSLGILSVCIHFDKENPLSGAKVVLQVIVDGQKRERVYWNFESKEKRAHGERERDNEWREKSRRLFARGRVRKRKGLNTAFNGQNSRLLLVTLLMCWKAFHFLVPQNRMAIFHYWISFLVSLVLVKDSTVWKIVDKFIFCLMKLISFELF